VVQGQATPPPKDGPLKRVPHVATFNVFMSNITSLSPHAKNYIFSLPKEIQLLCLSECHNKDKLQVEDLFRINGFHASYNPAEQANVLTHGGECVATRSFVNSRSVADTVFKAIEDFYHSKLRFAARIVRFHNFEVLFVCPYLWVQITSQIETKSFSSKSGCFPRC
jgi:hypothetical protein